ncbi:C39 family peptidase [Terribacillus saccharophilus]|uniref:S-layer protein n=1 Tax=Terribacillus saccharophilus TaxID=361277 RepID=A0ABX4GVU4_9BACI|nr:C39 family peptidase [Terribacillus saccharophilus]PAD34642.1 S-layer protein [Terribacillus saccharophilus]PAD95390.1 S-layer protein [Terribacillus saccharophilus]PAD98968.1 S-layer protein [Terribacillus saccharophilus]
MRLLDVPYIKQRPELPSGCEVTALAMALSYYGEDVDKLSLAREMPIDKTSVERNEDGTIRIWGDPEDGFVGDPFDNGITINPNPLKQVAEKYRSGSSALYGKAWDVIETHVANDRPVLVWFTIHHDMPTPRVWHTPAGKVVQAPRPLHCIVVTGADDDYVYFHDCESTEKSGEHVKVGKTQFIRIYDEMGRRALVIT